MARPVALVAFDSFKGSASATELCTAAAGALTGRFEVRSHPLSDGGDGFAEVLTAACATRRELEVDASDALGRPVRVAVPVLATPRGEVAVVESARVCGLAQVGGPAGNDPLGASTRGVGEVLSAVISAGCEQVVVGCGGSATTDGGQGALEVLESIDLGGIRLEVAVDVTTRFTQAAERFGPQKGANPEQVAELAQRLRWLAVDYAEAYATPVDRLAGSGAAGGLAGGLAALGARIVNGFDLVAELTELSADLDHAALVVTGEGRLDATSFEGKVVARLAERIPSSARLVVVAGSVEPATAGRLAEATSAQLEVVDLSATFGEAASLDRPTELVAEVLARLT